MAIDVKRGGDGAIAAAIQSLNDLRVQVTTSLTTDPHADVTSTTGGDFRAPVATAMTISVANATTLPTTIALANQAKLFYGVHIADANAHKNADATNVITAAAAADQTTSNTLLNDIKSKYNLHLAQATRHYTNDTTNAVTAADATDAGSSQTLATQIKAKFNAHIQAALSGQFINLIGP